MAREEHTTDASDLEILLASKLRARFGPRFHADVIVPATETSEEAQQLRTLQLDRRQRNQDSRSLQFQSHPKRRRQA